MGFRVSYSQNARGEQDVVLSVVIAGSNKLGAGIACKYEHLFTTETFLRFAEFVKGHRMSTDPDPWQIMIDLFPQNQKEIEKLINEQASAALQQKQGPLDAMRADGFPAFEDDDE